QSRRGDEGRQQRGAGQKAEGPGQRVHGRCLVGPSSVQFFVGGAQTRPCSITQGTIIPISQERAFRLVSATSIESDMPNNISRRQTIVKRRASIGYLFVQFRRENALCALNHP
ncbi:hypothetical protein AB4144_21505, partial [Rhizobiaceae sp. 2RAB30]